MKSTLDSTRNLYLGMGAALALSAAGTAEAQIFRQESPVRLFSKAQLDQIPNVHRTLFNRPLVIDASLTFLRQNAQNQVRVLWTSPWGIDWYKDGTVNGKDFFYNREFEAEHDEISPSLPTQWKPAGETSGGGRWRLNKNYSGPATADVDGFIQSVYKINASEYLGFIHIERSNQNMAQNVDPPIDRLYAIGIALSADAGKTWTYAGDVIRPSHDALGDTWAQSSTTPYYSNIGGVPYTVVTEGGIKYFYVYFNEYTLTPANPTQPASRSFTSVARAPLAAVIDEARTGSTVTRWRKYNPRAGGNWVELGIGGVGAGVLPHRLDDWNANHYDVHSRAAYSPSLKKHILIANEVDMQGLGSDARLWRRMVLFTSSDGLGWVRKQVVDESFGVLADGWKPAYNLMYGSIYSSAPGTSDDNNVVGKDFTVIYPRQYLGDYANSDLFSRKIVTTPDISPSLAITTLF